MRLLFGSLLVVLSTIAAAETHRMYGPYFVADDSQSSRLLIHNKRGDREVTARAYAWLGSERILLDELTLQPKQSRGNDRCRSQPLFGAGGVSHTCAWSERGGVRRLGAGQSRCTRRGRRPGHEQRLARRCHSGRCDHGSKPTILGAHSVQRSRSWRAQSHAQSSVPAAGRAGAVMGIAHERHIHGQMRAAHSDRATQGRTSAREMAGERHLPRSAPRLNRAPATRTTNPRPDRGAFERRDSRCVSNRIVRSLVRRRHRTPSRSTYQHRQHDRVRTRRLHDQS